MSHRSASMMWIWISCVAVSAVDVSALQDLVDEVDALDDPRKRLPKMRPPVKKATTSEALAAADFRNIPFLNR